MTTGTENRYAEYADADNDRLPNRFETLWFGKWGDLSTATAADPNADPDRDGKTNLEEWRAQTNPTHRTPACGQGQEVQSNRKARPCARTAFARRDSYMPHDGSTTRPETEVSDTPHPPIPVFTINKKRNMLWLQRWGTRAGTTSKNPPNRSPVGAMYPAKRESARGASVLRPASRIQPARQPASSQKS